MDPATATQLAASVAELIRVCKEIVQIIQEFRHGDKAITDLVHEVELFEEFLRGLRRILKHCRTSHGINAKTIETTLEHADATLLSLRKKLKPVQNTKSLAGRRLKWMLGRDDFLRLRIRVRDHNYTLGAILSVIQG
jgi:hypothetical protein